MVWYKIIQFQSNHVSGTWTMTLKQIIDSVRKCNLEKITVFNALICLCLVNLERILQFYGTQEGLDERWEKPNFLDGCYHVYLDVGTNVGIQVFPIQFYTRICFFSHHWTNFKAMILYFLRSRFENFTNQNFIPMQPFTHYLKNTLNDLNRCLTFVPSVSNPIQHTKMH